MNDQQRLLGINDLTSRLSRLGVNVIEHNQPRAHQQTTYFVVGKGDRVTDVELSDEFLCDLPKTREYQVAVESYAQTLAGRLRCGSPNLFYCMSNRAISISIRWPIQGSVSEDRFCAWLLVTVTDERDGSIARCCIDVNRQGAYHTRTTFDELRNSINSIRRAIDGSAVLFYASPQTHPESYQLVNEVGSRTKSTGQQAEIEKFIASKTYALGFQIPDIPGEVFATDPWDAEYLSVSRKELSQSAYMLRARSLIELDVSNNFARPSDKLITDGGPTALGPDRAVAAPQVFELSHLPKREDLDADLKSALKDRAELALIFVDLDRFKEVNDTKGHSQGNICLGAVVAAMGRVLGRKGKLYRWGGDEFVMTLPEFCTEEALATAERVRRAIEESKAGGDIIVTASIGVCATDRFPNAAAEELVDAADKAMYNSKHTGKNRVTSWPLASAA